MKPEAKKKIKLNSNNSKSNFSSFFLQSSSTAKKYIYIFVSNIILQCEIKINWGEKKLMCVCAGEREENKHMQCKK
jgi:hypothetical protein